MTDVAKLLRAARAKIERPECRCKGAYARDRLGNAVDADSPPAIAWCPIGALLWADRDNPNDDIYRAARTALVKALPVRPRYCSITAYNDARRTTHRKVLRWVDRAIAAAESA